MTDTFEMPFTIERATPETLSMARLAEYMADLAKLFGSVQQVHFRGIQSGSAVLQIEVEQDARPSVLPRVRDAAKGIGTTEAVTAWRQINRRLTDDESPANLLFPGGEVIPFPGIPKPEKQTAVVRQPTSIQGRLTRIEGSGDTVSVGIEDETGIIGKITIRPDMAQALGAHFQKYVRLTGEGRWKNGPDGRWLMERLHADVFEVLEDTPISEVLRQIREFVPAGTGERVIEYVREIRSS